MEFWKEVRRQVLTGELSQRAAIKKYSVGCALRTNRPELPLLAEGRNDSLHPIANSDLAIALHGTSPSRTYPRGLTFPFNYHVRKGAALSGATLDGGRRRPE